MHWRDHLNDKFPYERKNLDFEVMNGKVAATFCAASKKGEVEEGTPKELWKGASDRISKFVEEVERARIPYVILSYKYGLVASNEVIDNYNISKSEVDMSEWSEMISARADELNVEEVVSYGFLAQASNDISQALENSEPKITWAEDYEDLIQQFYTQEEIDQFTEGTNEDESEEAEQASEQASEQTSEQEKQNKLQIGDDKMSNLIGRLKEAGIESKVQFPDLDNISIDDLSEIDDDQLKGKHLEAHRNDDEELHSAVVKEMENRDLEHDSPLEDEEELAENVDSILVELAEALDVDKSEVKEALGDLL